MGSAFLSTILDQAGVSLRKHPIDPLHVYGRLILESKQQTEKDLFLYAVMTLLIFNVL